MEEVEARAAGGDHQPSDSVGAVATAPLPRVSSEGSSHEGDLMDTQPRGRDGDKDRDEACHDGGYKASKIAGRFIQVLKDGEVNVDTAAPIDSVKGAVSKFGGILDWRERRKQVQDELGKVNEEAAEYQRMSREAEAGKAQALRELGDVTGDIDDLWLTVKRAQIAQAQARKDSELAELRLREMEKVTRERGAAKAELNALRDRHADALNDLRSVREVMEALHRERAVAVDEAAALATRARETVASSREADKSVEEIASELRSLKQELIASRAAHDAVEEKRMRAGWVLQQEMMQWNAELEQAELEARNLVDEVAATSDLESKVSMASELLVSLRAELFAHAVEGTDEEEEEKEKPTSSNNATLGKTRKELEEVKVNVEKVNDEAKILRVVTASLHADLKKEKAELSVLRRKEAASLASVPPLEEKLSHVASALAATEANTKEIGDKTSSCEQLGEARREAERAKASARAAHEEVAAAREEASTTKAAIQAMEARLEDVMREMHAAHAAEEIATASATALLQEVTDAEASQAAIAEGYVVLTAEEYDELSRRTWETEEATGRQVVEVVKLIKEAKDSEVRSLEKLAQLAKQTEQRRQALRAATAEAEEMEFNKLGVERDLRELRLSEQRHAWGEIASPRTGLAEITCEDGRDVNPHILSPRGGYMPRPASDMSMATMAEEAKHRKTFFPRMVTYLARKRAQSWGGR